MNVNQLIDNHPEAHTISGARASADALASAPGYPQWQDIAHIEHHNSIEAHSSLAMSGMSPTDSQAHSTSGPYLANQGLPPKQVTFEYLLTEGTQQRARLPMRVNIYPHDGTDSIITTVKNFYGLYDGNGVSFEDKDGCTLIARYENFQDRMVVYVRVVENVGSHGGTPRNSMSPRRPRLGPPFQLTVPEVHDQPISRPASRATRNRSASPPAMHGRRSQSTSTNSRARARAMPKSRTGSAQGSLVDHNGDVDVSDSDGGNASVTSSRRGKIDVVASAEISVDNIVEGGRRKRARFDSSELPLFVPSQVPMQNSVSSVSPQRRIGSQPAASPYQYGHQHTFSWSNALPSPQSHHNSEHSYMGNGVGVFSGQNNPSHGSNRTRQRGTVQYGPARHTYLGGHSGILPTPDPTIGGSVISDDEVARQLMALGDPSNFSNHGRTSTSTADDAFSGKAELASSVDESVEGSIDGRDTQEEALYTDESSEEVDDGKPGSALGASGVDRQEDMQARTFKVAKTKTNSTAPQKARSFSNQKSAKGGKARLAPVKQGKERLNPGLIAPISPTSLPPQSRKASNASLQQPGALLAADEEDLSSKPRCQRCRKSKKGCDRQRPCGRCKDAGIGIEGCISEDEGNGRKGRYGRHIGVTIKKAFADHSPTAIPATSQPVLGSMAAPNFLPDKNSKKRKR